MKRSVFVGMFLAMAVLVAACGGSSEPTPAPAAGSAQEVLNQIDVAMHDIYYGEENNNVEKPPVWTVKSGDEVALNMDNKGALEHSWALLKAGSEVPMPFTDANKDLLLYDSGALKPSTQKADKFTAPAKGEYTVICTIAGHYPVMQGRLIVQ
jgi:plastocyanin